MQRSLASGNQPDSELARSLQADVASATSYDLPAGASPSQRLALREGFQHSRPTFLCFPPKMVSTKLILAQSHSVRHIVRILGEAWDMTWSYRYPATTAVHEPTGLSFCIAYDQAKPAWTIRLDSEPPDLLDQAGVDSLRDELDQLVRAGRTQRRMSELLHGAYNGDYSHAAAILSSQTKRNVSVRTLQAWMMPPGRPSSRRCPEWALLALEEYLASHPDAPRHWREVSSIYRSTPDGQTLALHTELRDQRSLQLAEVEIAHEDAIRRKWRGAGVAELVERLSDLELQLRRVTGEHTALIGQIVAVTFSCTTFEEFREQLREATLRKANLDRVIRETVDDISRGQKEFSNVEGTLPD